MTPCYHACRNATIRKLGGRPTIHNAACFLPRRLSRKEKATLQFIDEYEEHDRDLYVRLFTHVTIGGEVFRVKDADSPSTTAQRYFKATFQTSFVGGGEGRLSRYAELTKIIRLHFDGKDVILLRADWFPSRAASIHPITKNVHLRLGYAMDRTTEACIQANAIDGQVAICDLYSRSAGDFERRAVVFDRRLFRGRIEIMDDEDEEEDHEEHEPEDE